MARLKFLLGPLVVGMLVIGLELPAQATTRTFTGAELFSDPNVLFPTTTPTVSGSSLIFGVGTVIHEKLFVLLLFPSGILSGLTPETISVSINLTRLTSDWDPHLILGDGTNFFGAVIADNVGGQFLGTTLSDSGTFGTRLTLSSVFTGARFPSIGNSFDINAEFTLQTWCEKRQLGRRLKSGITLRRPTVPIQCAAVVTRAT